MVRQTPTKNIKDDKKSAKPRFICFQHLLKNRKGCVTRLRPKTSVTRFGNFLPFLGFSEAFGDNFFAQNCQFIKALMQTFWHLKNLFIYCGDKSGDFQQNICDFFSEHCQRLQVLTNLAQKLSFGGKSLNIKPYFLTKLDSNFIILNCSSSKQKGIWKFSK